MERENLYDINVKYVTDIQKAQVQLLAFIQQAWGHQVEKVRSFFLKPIPRNHDQLWTVRISRDGYLN